MKPNYKLQRMVERGGRTVRAIGWRARAGADMHRGPPLNRALGCIWMRCTQSGTQEWKEKHQL
jgi:hypothetical protein